MSGNAPRLEPLYVLAGLLVLGVLLQWAAARLKLPAIVLLLGAGLLLGPIANVIDPDAMFGELLPALVSLAVAVVLFEGGLSLRISEAKKLGWPLLALVLGGLVVTLASTALAARHLAGLSLPTSLVLGSILVVTGPTVIKPLLRQARLARRPALLLKWESIVNDALGALLAVIALEGSLAAANGVDGALAEFLDGVPLLVVTAGLAGLSVGWLLGRATDSGAVPEHLKTPAILGGVVGVFAGCEALHHEAGLLGVTVMGVVLANLSSPNLESVRRFKEDITTILVSLLFLVLAARLSFSDLAGLTGGALLLVLAVIFVVRPLAVWLSLGATRIPWREKLWIGWIAPRGVVAAAMGAALGPRLVAAGYPDGAQLVPILFAVILATVVLHGLTAGPLARKLGLAAQGEGGLLIVGASGWAIDLAGALERAGLEVVLVDDDYRSVARARLAGREVVNGDVLQEETLDRLPLERIGWVLAATDDDSYNALVCVALGGLVGRERTLQLPLADGEETDPHLSGRIVWSDGATYGRLAGRHWTGAAFKTSSLSPEFQLEDFRAHQGDVQLLFAVRDGRLVPLGLETQPPDGGKLVYQATEAAS